MIDKLLQHGNVFLHDHLGFGFSDAPGGDFTYSLSEGAENALAIWRKLGIKKAHIVSHDMGDSIVAEILSRYHRSKNDFEYRNNTDVVFCIKMLYIIYI